MTGITTLLFFLTALVAGPLQAADDAVDTDTSSSRVTQLSQADTTTDQSTEEDAVLEEARLTAGFDDFCVEYMDE